MSIRFNTLAMALASIGLVTGLAGCGGGSSAGRGGLPVTPVLNRTDAAFQIQFIDAITGAIIRDPLTVSFTGPSVADLRQPVDANRDSRYDTLPASLTTRDGVVPVLALRFTDPADSFQVSASGGDWLASGAEVKPGSTPLVTVRLMKASASSADFVAAAVSGSVSNGVVVAATTASTDAATLQIPAATRATQPDGTPAAPGPLTVSVVRFSVGTDPLPLTSTLTGKTFSLGDQVGVVRFSVTDSNGAEISQFDQDLTLSVKLPAGSTFPGTNTPLTGNETNFPIRYYDEALKQWVSHGSDGTVSQNADHSFTISFKSRHLSLWTLNPSHVPGSSCIFSTLNLTGRPAGDTTPITLSIVGSSFSKTIGPIIDSSLSLLYAPNETVTLSVTAPAGVSVSPSTVNLCSPGTNSANLTGLQPQVLTSLTVNVRQTCRNNQSLSAPLPTSVYFQYQLPSGLYTTLGDWTGDDGSITMSNIPLNTLGELKIWNPYLSPNADYVYPTNTTAPAGYQITQDPQTLDYPVLVDCPTGTSF